MMSSRDAPKAAWSGTRKHPLSAWLTVNERSQKWLAEKLDVPESVVSKMLHGSTLPRPTTLLAIAKLTGLSLQALMEAAK